MSDQFIGEIRIFALTFAPLNFMTCQGQALPVRQYTALFSILGVNFGGDGVNYFNLPDLQGRCPIGTGQGPGTSLHTLGEPGGVSTVTLKQDEMPLHIHTLTAAGVDGTTMAAKGNQPAIPRGAVTKQSSNIGQVYSSTGTGVSTVMAPGSIGVAGLNKAHENMMPYLPLTFCIGVNGAFPPRPPS